IVGQGIRINGKAATIIGVMPPNFKFPVSEELWTPLYNEFPPVARGELRIGASNPAPAIMGRLKAGVTLDQANAEFIALARHLAVDFYVRAINTLPFPAPYYWKFTIDGSVIVFTVAITLLATIASGLVPAFLSARGNAAEMMKEGGRGNSSRLVNAITRVLVVGQIALTAALLIAATLQIKSIRNQMKLDYGYD